MNPKTAHDRVDIDAYWMMIWTDRVKEINGERSFFKESICANKVGLNRG